METIVNLTSLIGWAYLLVQTEIQLVFNLDNYVTSDISLTLWILRAVQLIQVFDIVLLLIGKSKGNFVAAFFQILGRNIVTLIIIEQDTNRLAFAAVIIVWSIAEVNRYLYYIFKNNAVTGFLRYNSFLILYPLGGVAQTLNFNDYFNRHPDLPEINYYFLKFVNGCILIAIVLLYTHMLKARKRYMKGSKKDVEATPVENKSRREEIKRD